ncbi:hypothetical protein [uncultured Photobacterium sp.]|uniref:hypothetical protein n=1 Tax=uncultured Photobacterium sp. TaxID=173973 RepID=UPI0026221234|nr:hypothetical protein [uncultured Photobacterium sp.]
MNIKQARNVVLVVVSIFSSMAFAASVSSVSWSGRVLSGVPINISTDGNVVNYEAWGLPQVESIKISDQFEVNPISKEVSILTVKL